LSIDSVPKVPMPPTAATVVVPLRVPRGVGADCNRHVGSVAGHQVVELVEHLHVTAGLMATPATVLLGCTPKSKWFAAGVMLKVLDVAPPRLPSAAVNV